MVGRRAPRSVAASAGAVVPSTERIPRPAPSARPRSAGVRQAICTPTRSVRRGRSPYARSYTEMAVEKRRVRSNVANVPHRPRDFKAWLGSVRSLGSHYGLGFTPSASNVAGQEAVVSSSNETEIHGHRVRKHELQSVAVEPVHPLENAAKHRTIFRQHGKVAILVQRLRRHDDLFTGDPAALNRAAEHPINAAMTVIGAVRPVLSKRAAELGQDYDD